MSAAHTPGPWKAGTICAVSGWVDISCNDNTRKCEIIGSTRHDNAEANARLIAAAPAMYEAISQFRAWFREYSGEQCIADLEQNSPQYRALVQAVKLAGAK